MTARHPFETALATVWPPQAWQDVTVLLAISGGADSVALLRAMVALKTAGAGRLVAAHLNHQLRAEESTADERFVVELCRTLAVPCQVHRSAVAEMAHVQSESLESAARQARYQFLRTAAEQAGARYIVTAHTANDQAETILHRIVRGTGIRGLAGMARTRNLGPATTVIRPMLGQRRAEVVAYLEDLEQPYRSDASNADVRFTRNRIRHELLPQLAAHYNPAVVDALLRLGTLAGEAQAVVNDLVDRLSEQNVTVEGPQTASVARAAGDQPGYLVREMLMRLWRGQSWPMQSMGRAEWDELAGMLTGGQETAESPPAKRTLPGNIMAHCDGERLWLMRH